MNTHTIRLHRVLKAKPELVYKAFLDPDAAVESLTAAAAAAPPLALPLAPPLSAEREPLLRQPAAPAAAAG